MAVAPAHPEEASEVRKLQLLPRPSCVEARSARKKNPNVVVGRVGGEEAGDGDRKRMGQSTKEYMSQGTELAGKRKMHGEIACSESRMSAAQDTRARDRDRISARDTCQQRAHEPGTRDRM